MANHPYWEDVDEGSQIPPLVKRPTTRQLVRYAGVSGDFYEIHYDKDFAKSTGLSGVILHGALKSAFLGQMLTDWIGPTGRFANWAASIGAWTNRASPSLAAALSPRSTTRRGGACWTATSGWRTSRAGASPPAGPPSSFPAEKPSAAPPVSSRLRGPIFSPSVGAVREPPALRPSQK